MISLYVLVRSRVVVCIAFRDKTPPHTNVARVEFIVCFQLVTSVFSCFLSTQKTNFSQFRFGL